MDGAIRTPLRDLAIEWGPARMQDRRGPSILTLQVCLPSTAQVGPGGVCVVADGGAAGAGVAEGGAGSNCVRIQVLGAESLGVRGLSCVVRPSTA